MWQSLSPTAQDALTLVMLLVPIMVIGLILVRGYTPWPLVRTMLRRFRVPAVLFIALIAVSVAIGVGLLAQERGLRTGSAAITDKFDLIVTRPNSDVSALMNTVFLQPDFVPLIDGATFAEIAARPRVQTATPLGFGDSYKGAPVIGTTAEFVVHLSDGALVDGRMFATYFEAVAGANIDLVLGDSFEPAHGLGDAAEEGVHDTEITIVGTMPSTGSPWDNAILVPIESVWDTHGLANGHDPATLPKGQVEETRIGPPFDADFFPGTPSILITADSLGSLYGLQQQIDAELDLMAFFPGAVLSRLHSLLGDIRAAMSVLAVVTQCLVALAVIVGLALLVRLFARQIAILRATGAPTRFLLATVWCFATTLLAVGTATGLLLGLAAARIMSGIISAQTQVAIPASLGWPELHLAALFLMISSIAALIPAILTARQPVISNLRA